MWAFLLALGSVVLSTNAFVTSSYQTPTRSLHTAESKNTKTVTTMQAESMSRADALLTVGTAFFGAAAVVTGTSGPAHAVTADQPASGIHVGKTIGSKKEALAIIRKHKNLLYLATDANGDIAYKNDEDATKRGFQGLKELGDAAGIEMKHYPLKVDSLTASDADNLVEILTGLPRPTYIMCKSGARASALKALYLARLADLKEEKDLKKNIGTDLERLWLKIPAAKDWVLSNSAVR
ncbi:hypothetical protein VYU27_000798 [Nannochloropsis oceanica]